jgi:hypothetical protein
MEKHQRTGCFSYKARSVGFTERAIVDEMIKHFSTTDQI